VELGRHYTYKFCSPSRSAFLSGRLPVHVNIYNDDPAMEGAGVPTNMTMISTRLTEAGYASHFIGKWHVGMASRSRSMPTSRGFESSLGYFHSRNDYYNETRSQGCDGLLATDLWSDGKPAHGLNGTVYEEIIFGNRAQQIIKDHAGRYGPATRDNPMFLYYAFHTSCVGTDERLQPERKHYERFSFIKDEDRRANNAMIALMDEIVGNISRTLQDQGMWNDTLILWSSDNGGAVHLHGGANSWPLRGGYFSNWEGGIRAPALLSGGFLPQTLHNRTVSGFIHIADWYATFCHLAGKSPHDRRAEESLPKLPGIDSKNVWPLIIGMNETSPRMEWPLTPFGEDPARAPHGGDDAAYMAEGRYKLLVGQIRQSGWCGQIHPNLTKPWDSFNTVEACTVPEKGKIGCLFDVLEDPGEHHDLAIEMPQKAKEIFQKMKEAEKLWFNPDRGSPDPKACVIASETGFWQPFLP